MPATATSVAAASSVNATSGAADDGAIASIDSAGESLHGAAIRSTAMADDGYVPSRNKCTPRATEAARRAGSMRAGPPPGRAPPLGVR